jgi:hypothetical protein
MQDHFVKFRKNLMTIIGEWIMKRILCCSYSFPLRGNYKNNKVPFFCSKVNPYFEQQIKKLHIQ